MGKKRNLVIHKIADVKIKTSELREIAENGIKYAQKLQSISRQYKKAKMTDEDKQAIKERPYFKLHKHKEKVHRKFSLKHNDELELFVGDNKILHIKIVDNIIQWKEIIDNEIVKKQELLMIILYQNFNTILSISNMKKMLLESLY